MPKLKHTWDEFKVLKSTSDFLRIRLRILFTTQASWELTTDYLLRVERDLRMISNQVRRKVTLKDALVVSHLDYDDKDTLLCMNVSGTRSGVARAILEYRTWIACSQIEHEDMEIQKPKSYRPRQADLWQSNRTSYRPSPSYTARIYPEVLKTVVDEASE